MFHRTCRGACSTRETHTHTLPAKRRNARAVCRVRSADLRSGQRSMSRERVGGGRPLRGTVPEPKRIVARRPPLSPEPDTDVEPDSASEYESEPEIVPAKVPATRIFVRRPQFARSPPDSPIPWMLAALLPASIADRDVEDTSVCPLAIFECWPSTRTEELA